MGEDLFYLASKLMRFALYVELWPHILGALGVMALLLRWRRAALGSGSYRLALWGL